MQTDTLMPSRGMYPSINAVVIFVLFKTYLKCFFLFSRMNLLQDSGSRMATDGINSLKYKLRKKLELPLVTVVNVVLSKSMYPAI